MDFISEAKCLNIATIKEINKQFDYEDKHPRGKGDSSKVACGQEGYNELENIYKTKLQKFVDNKRITKEEAIQAICYVCHKLPNPRIRDKFYSELEKQLNIKF